jgi:hypothetical protein
MLPRGDDLLVYEVEERVLKEEGEQIERTGRCWRLWRGAEHENRHEARKQPRRGYFT